MRSNKLTNRWWGVLCLQQDLPLALFPTITAQNGAIACRTVCVYVRICTAGIRAVADDAQVYCGHGSQGRDPAALLGHIIIAEANYRGLWVKRNGVQGGQLALFLNRGWDTATPASPISYFLIQGGKRGRARGPRRLFF